MKLIAINRKTGMQANEGEPGTIIEAFKPGTGPADSYWVIGMGADGSNAVAERVAKRIRRRRPTEAIRRTGGGRGLYLKNRSSCSTYGSGHG